MSEHPSDHLATYVTESAALDPTAWEHWINRVEALMGHDADGDITTDGSIDTFNDMWEAGLAPEAASLRIVGGLFVTPDGTTYRLARACKDSTFEPYAERYDILTELGHSVRYELPAGAVLAWAPDRGVSAVGTCIHCGRLVGFDTVTTDEWRASAHCLACLNGSPLMPDRRNRSIR